MPACKAACACTAVLSPVVDDVHAVLRGLLDGSNKVGGIAAIIAAPGRLQRRFRMQVDSQSGIASMIESNGSN
jgi:hypothetical protein